MHFHSFFIWDEENVTLQKSRESSKD